MSAVLLPAREAHLLPPASRVQEPHAGGVGRNQSTPPAPWMHDTCPMCGFDGDVALITLPDEGVSGWDCPDCHTFVTTRDLEDA